MTDLKNSRQSSNFQSTAQFEKCKVGSLFSLFISNLCKASHFNWVWYLWSIAAIGGTLRRCYHFNMNMLPQICGMELSITVHRIKFLFLVDNSFNSCHLYNPPERIRTPHVYYFWLFFLSNTKISPVICCAWHESVIYNVSKENGLISRHI